MDIETAKKLNQRYCSEHYFTQSCLDVINDMIERMTALRAGKEPTVQDGDKVICANLDGVTQSPHGHIEWDGDDMVICKYPSIPYVSKHTLRCQASGGLWSTLSDEDMKRFQYQGTAEKTFWTWGPGGQQAYGGLYFPIEVNVWRLVHRKF